MNKVIIESPFKGETLHEQNENVLYARECMKHSLEIGEAPIASHLLYPQVLDDTDSNERQWGIDAGLAWRKVADYAVFYVDRGMSNGMKAAHELYLKEGIPMEMRHLWK